MTYTPAIPVAGFVDLPAVTPNEGEGRELFLARLFDLIREIEVAAICDVRPELIYGVTIRVKIPEEWGFTAAVLAVAIGGGPAKYISDTASILAFQRTYYVPDASRWVTEESPLVLAQ